MTAGAVATAAAAEGRVETRLGRHSILSFVGAMTSAGLGFLLVVVLARTLGDAHSGIVLQAMAVFMIALGLARFGMDSTAVWLLPRLVDDEPRTVRATAWFLVLVAGAAGLACTGIIYGGTWVLGAVDPTNPLLAAVRAVAPFLPFMAMLLTALAVSRALGRIAEYVFIGNVGLPLLRLGCVAVVIWAGTSVAGVAFAWVLPVAVALAVALPLLTGQIRAVTRVTTDAVSLRGTAIPRRALGFAGPRVISAVLEQLLVWVSVLIVGVVATAADAGVYGVASRLVAAGLVVDTAIRVVVAPLFSRLHNRGEISALRRLHATATTWLVLFSAPVFMVIAVFSGTVLSIMGEDFVAGSTALSIMSLGVLFAFLAGNVQTMLLTAGRSGLAAGNKAVVVALNIVLIPPLMALWGVTGAAVAFTVACIADALLAWCEIRWVLKLPISHTAGIYALGVCALSIGAPAIVARIVLGDSFVSLIAALGVAVVAYSIWCFASRARLGLTSAPSAGPAPDPVAAPPDHISHSIPQKSGTP